MITHQIGPIASGIRPIGLIDYPVDLSLINPGAEAGTLTGWTTISGMSSFLVSTKVHPTNSGYPGPKYGTYYFVPTQSSNSGMYQDVDISFFAPTIDAGGVVVILNFWFTTYDGSSDLANIYLNALDASNVIISTTSMLGIIAKNYTSWVLEDTGMVLPIGTRKIRISAHASRQAGADNDVYFDEFSLKLYEPGHPIPPRYDSTISVGNRTSLITVTASGITAGRGTPTNLVDGTLSYNYYWVIGVGTGAEYLKFDFGVSSSWIIDEFIWRQDNDTSHGIWKFEGSNDDSSWTQIGNDFTLSAGLNRHGNPYNDAYRYVRLRHMSGTRSSSPWLRGIQFRAKN